MLGNKVTGSRNRYSVRDRIISAEGPAGETREVGVLFSDLGGFTPLTEGAPARVA